MKVEEELKGLRESIDQLDLELVRLINKRMELSREIGRIKAEKGFSLFDPSREEIVFKRVVEANSGPVSDESLRAIYREIFAASRVLQHVLKVDFLGPASMHPDNTREEGPTATTQEFSLCGCLLDAPPDEIPRYLNHPGIDLLEWRIDVFTRRHGEEALLQSLPLLAQQPRHPVLATNRPRREGGEFDGTEERRINLLQRAAQAGAEWVDLEEDTSADDLKWFKSRNIRVLLSHHDFTSTPDFPTLRRMVEQMAKREPDAIKIVANARSSEDNLRILELIPFGRKEFGINVLAFCMGPIGRWSRFACLLLGSPWTYIQLPGQSSAARGQFTMDEMRTVLSYFGE